ncbi:MAG TPA: proton-conducting transporter membrane subunit [Acidimicrobiia bacterium]|nr:proton-conducting transporter membrane subunit [Acidimicrobiia bacterium]
MTVLASYLPLVPLLAGIATGLFGWRRSTALAAVVGSAGVTTGGVILGTIVVDRGAVIAAGGLVRVDALSAYLILIIGVASLISSAYAVGYIDTELRLGHTTPQGARLYGLLVQIFIACMLIAVSTDNIGVMWVAVEATTIATAFLVGHRRTRAAVEASWKYVVIASVGVSIAFLGIVLLYFASRHASVGAATLRWSQLLAMAGKLDPAVTRLAAGAVIIGFGTKAGLAPFHTWLPDAHSQAPAPVSALMSGVLLSVSFYVLARHKVVIDAVLGPAYMRNMLIAVGLLSLGVAASLLIAQRDYKRLLAYSSIEHMGLVAFGTAIGSPLAVAGALYHMLGHAIAKSVAFCASGEILFDSGTTRIADVRGLLKRRPALGTVFGLALLALLGIPPFSLFASEVAILRAAGAAHLELVMVLAAALLLVAFVSILQHGRQMLLGEPTGGHTDRRTPAIALTTLAIALGASAVLGVTLGPLDRLLTAASRVVAP